MDLSVAVECKKKQNRLQPRVHGSHVFPTEQVQAVDYMAELSLSNIFFFFCFCQAFCQTFGMRHSTRHICCTNLSKNFQYKHVIPNGLRKSLNFEIASIKVVLRGQGKKKPESLSTIGENNRTIKPILHCVFFFF